MHLKRALTGLLTAIVIVAGVPTAYAQSDSATTSGTVVVNEVGVFNVELCYSAGFKTAGQNPSVTAVHGAIATAWVNICYTDTMSSRGAFTTTLVASDFVSITPGVTDTIPATNLYLGRTVRPRHAAATMTNPGAGIIYSTSPAGEIQATTTIDGSSVWWSYQTYDLSTPRAIGRADAGRGISQAAVPTLASQYVDLFIPAGQRPATYRTTYTLTVAPAAP